MNIGFIGLGNMGSGMAANLSRYCQTHAHKLFVFDLNQQAVQAQVEQGAVASASVAELAAKVDLVFTSLPSSKEIELVAAALLPELRAASAWFETSTNQLDEWRKIQAQANVTANAKELKLIDAPVTGGAEGAAAGTLTMLLGIDEVDLEYYQPILSSFTAKAVRMGPSGAGYATKLCQLHLNYLVAQGIGEALMLGAKSGIELATLYEVLQTSCAQSYVVDSYIPKVLDGSYDPSFTLGLATKDMRLINQLAEHLSVSLPLGSEVLANYELATERYGDQAPHLKIVKLLEDQNNEALR